MEYLFREHIKKQITGPSDGKTLSDICFQYKEEAKCARFFEDSGNFHVECSYYVGADWVPHLEKKWMYVEPKLNTKFDGETGAEQDFQEENALVQVDVLKMLFQALEEPEVRDHTKELFEIKFESSWIPLQKHQDLISPLIMIQFLNQVKDIVRKGLKKSYYKVERNLYAKVKGKVLVSKTIKQNLVKNKNLNTFCQYEEFGVDGLENRLLKKTLTFVRRYLTTIKGFESEAYIQETFSFIQPAFEKVSEEVQLHEVKHFKFNPFYKNYDKAIELAKLILQRFSYNLNSIQNQDTIETPPYWIDMSKLFELYVLGMLKKEYGSKITYHESTYGNEVDFLLSAGDNSLIIDAKYKPGYIGKSHQGLHADIRQVSGYARHREIRRRLKVKDNNLLLGCVIIYPDLSLIEENIGDLRITEVSQYEKAWKVGVKLPVIKSKSSFSKIVNLEVSN